MNQKIGLFDYIDERILSLDIIKIDEEHVIHSYTLDDNSVYNVPYKIIVSDEEVTSLSNNVFKQVSFQMPSDADGIGKICYGIFDMMMDYLRLKEFSRYITFTSKEYGATSDFNQYAIALKEEVFEAGKTIKRVLEFMAKLAPAWWQRKVDIPGIPEYHGSNPCNIFGVDHKFDYQLNVEKYKANLRDVIYSIASGSIEKDLYKPFESTIYSATPLEKVYNEFIKMQSEQPVQQQSSVDKTNSIQQPTTPEVRTSDILQNSVPNSPAEEKKKLINATLAGVQAPAPAAPSATTQSAPTPTMAPNANPFTPGYPQYSGNPVAPDGYVGRHGRK